MTMDASWIATLESLYPAVADLDAALRASVLSAQAHPMRVTAGTPLFDIGAPCAGFPFVLDGEVRVERGSAQGRSLEFYRVGPGDVCVVSASCLFARGTLTAHGVAARDTELVVLGPAGFDAWCADAAFRRFVFGIFAQRLTDLMALVEAVAFQRLDQRLAAALLGHGAVLRLTHQRLADDLGTAREIITRLLQRFERRGWVLLGRERIEIVDAAALRSWSAGHDPGDETAM